MRYVIATGGTGGHIYPATALVDEIKRKEPNSQFLFIGSNNRMEAKEIPALGYRFHGLNVIGTNGGLASKASSILKMSKAYFECRKLLKQEKPDVVIGFGNYISVPVILAAHHLNILTFLHEQNSYAGKANRFLGRYVDGIIGCYKENLEQFPKDKVRILGNPRAVVASQVKKDRKVIEELGLNPNQQLVVIVMGSLGSESVNKVMKEALIKMSNKPYQVLYVTGKNHYESFVQGFGTAQNICILPYIDGCKVMVNADLCVVRGGATTAAEITAMGMPSIIIPSPYVPNNHQVKNAEALQDEKAAFMLEEKDLTVDKIVSMIEEMLNDQSLLKSMSFNALKLSKKDATDKILDWIKELKG